MKVILLEPLENLGDVGQVVNVKPGYARNYLFPRGLAAPATPSNLKALEAKIRAQAKKAAERRAEAERLKEMLEPIVLKIKVKAGETKIYGSVTARDIARELSEQHGIAIDPKRLDLKRPIKELGAYELTYKPHPEVPITLRVWVLNEEGRGVFLSEEGEPISEAEAKAEAAEAKAGEAEGEA
jgi:large subunit ribosomal protein L9